VFGCRRQNFDEARGVTDALSEDVTDQHTRPAKRNPKAPPKSSTTCSAPTYNDSQPRGIMEAGGDISRILRIDLVRAWRQPPAIASINVLGISTGFFYVIAGLSALAALPWLGPKADTTSIAVLAVLTLVCGTLFCAYRLSIPRWGYSLTVFFGTLLITATVLLGHGCTASTAMAMYYFFVGVHTAFFFSIRTGLIQFLALFVCAVSALQHVGIPFSTDIVLVACNLAIMASVMWLSRLIDAAEEDPLTELINRRGLDLRLQEALRNSRVDGSPLAVAIIDLDNFKRVNDTISHLAGDQLLVASSRAWRTLVPANAHLGRYGGDEFVLVLSGYTLDAAAKLADKLRQATPDNATASIGVAAWAPGDSASMLISRADAALYEAKSAGRNRVAVHD
jgi:diguanylate cyclase